MAEPDPLVAVRDVHFSYDASVPALRGVSLTLGSGEFVALVGANGSGKTTLARHLNGLLHPDSGCVLVAGRDTRQCSVGQLAQTVGYVFQNPDHQIFLPTVEAEVAYGPRNLGAEGDDLRARVDEALERFGLVHLRHRHPMLLGRATRRQVALAAVYAMRPRVLVLDEPTGGLDRRATIRLMSLLEDMVAAGQTVVLITHDMRLVADHARRMVVMRDGLIVADGAPADLLFDGALLGASGLRPPQVARLAASLAPLGMPPVLTVERFSAAFVDRLTGGHGQRVGRRGRGRERDL